LSSVVVAAGLVAAVAIQAVAAAERVVCLKKS
jgi:hypothetical protein